MTKTVVIINLYSSAQYLSEQLQKAQIHSVALYTVSLEKILPYCKPAENLFDKQVYLDNPDVEEIIKTVKSFHPDYILNGSEAAAYITDQVTTIILPALANDPKTTSARADKYEMQEALKRKNLPHIEQQKVHLYDLDAEFIKKLNLEFPCFCKPLKGLGTIGAFKAMDTMDLLNHIHDMASDITMFDPTEYLIQEFIEGDEYFVDTFSHRGKYYVSSIQKYKKELINKTPVYRYTELVDNETIWNKCADFVKQCLAATQFNNGFAHTEIFIKPNGELRLVEINPRISGAKGYCNKLSQLVNLKSQTDLLIASLKGDVLEESLWKNRHGYARFLFLFNFFNHPLKDPADKLRKFTAVKFYSLLRPEGYVSTADQKNASEVDLILMLAHDDKNILEKETQAIIEMERAGDLF